MTRLIEYRLDKVEALLNVGRTPSYITLTSAQVRAGELPYLERPTKAYIDFEGPDSWDIEVENESTDEAN